MSVLEGRGVLKHSNSLKNVERMISQEKHSIHTNYRQADNRYEGEKGDYLV